MAYPIEWRTLCEDSVVYEAPVDHEASFNKVIEIWKNQIQALNRRVLGASKVEKDAPEYLEILRKMPKELLNIVEEVGDSFEVRKLISRRQVSPIRVFELSFIDSCGSDQFSFVFFPLVLDPKEDDPDWQHPHIAHPYRVSVKIIDETSLRLNISVPSTLGDRKFTWLREVAFSGLLRWIQRIDPKKEIRPTNRLLSMEKYGETYLRLKNSRGRSIVEKWTEKTNPHKYVYEDCGIASYILQTWIRLGRSPKYFADLGCGNGLLVHLLKEEGYRGVGFDIRERKIWKSLFADADLREAVVDPTVTPNVIPPDVDYLIGNHSDELTPWIPVMAARLRCEFFVIPCCAFDFHGKYNCRPGDQGSTYEKFLDFVRYIAKTLGYSLEEDRMSIPSSKRLCLIGSIPPEGLPPPEEIENRIAELTKDRGGRSLTQFVARPKVEEVRNCSKIPREIQRQLALKVFKELLEGSDKRIDGWRCGATVPLSKLIAILTLEEKALMKQQDGGFQTFLKNQYQIFHVYGGSCRIRDWRQMREPVKVSEASKNSPCWMHENHPDGCPYGEQCRFTHQVDS